DQLRTVRDGALPLNNFRKLALPLLLSSSLKRRRIWINPLPVANLLTKFFPGVRLSTYQPLRAAFLIGPSVLLALAWKSLTTNAGAPKEPRLISTMKPRNMLIVLR